MELKIVQIKDEYINYMRNFFPNTIMDNKQNKRKHTRKYIGIILKIDDFEYYVPLSSPKKSDYEKDGISIRKSNNIILRIINKKKLVGTIKLNNMLPVLNSEVELYDINSESDEKYKQIILDEIRWIKRNYNIIVKNAKKLYDLKNNESAIINEKNKKFFNSILNFKEAEVICLKYNS